MTNLFLVGYRGTGKTTIGKIVAKKLNRPFVDADELLVARTGKKIPDIFAFEGEAKFRAYETETLREICKQDNQVVGCGGGVVTREENIALLKKNGVVCLLTADPKTIYQRIYHDKNRPALTDKDPLQEIIHMLEQRKELYENTKDIVVDTNTNNKEMTAKTLIEKFTAYLDNSTTS